MGCAPNITDGIPTLGAFDGAAGKSGRPFGSYRDGQWHVRERLNRTEIMADRPVRRYRHRPRSYDAMIKDAAAREPNSEAVVCGERRVSWSAFNAMIERTAYGYVAAGLAVGNRVAVMLDNRLEYLVAMLAAIRAGGIAIPLGIRLGPADVDHVIRDAMPTFVVTARQWLDRFDPKNSCTRIFLVDGMGDDARFETLQAASSQPLPDVTGDDVAMIVYTSGTTGKPKGVCLTQDNLLHTCLHYLYALAIDRPLRSLLVIPATHIAGFGPLACVTMASAGTIVMARRFDPADALERIARERIDYAVLVPSMYQLLAMKASVGNYDLSNWIYGVYGGAIMPPATIERFSQVMPGLRMINAYGATETCAVSTIMPPELTAAAPASVGLALECVDIEIMDSTGKPVADGASGELWIRGPNVSPGYWNDPAATRSSFHNGYWKSGDVGYRDEKGLIYISDRLKDMINRGGFKISSAEVENALMIHPEIVDCAVVGVADPVLGEKIYAKITTHSSMLTQEELDGFLKRRIADYKVPDFWKIDCEAIPRNQNGKIQKEDVRRSAQTDFS